MLSRKHYQAVASRFAELRRNVLVTPTDEIADRAYAMALTHIAQDLASYFKSDNPAFDRDKFLAACGIKS